MIGHGNIFLQCHHGLGYQVTHDLASVCHTNSAHQVCIQQHLGGVSKTRIIMSTSLANTQLSSPPDFSLEWLLHVGTMRR